MVAAGVADRAPERIAALAYLDAFVPKDGQSWWDLAGEGFRALIIERARHDGLTVEPPAGPDIRRRPHSIGSFLQSLHLTRAEKPMPRLFVYATGWNATPFAAQYERLRHDSAWQSPAWSSSNSCRSDRPRVRTPCHPAAIPSERRGGSACRRGR